MAKRVNFPLDILYITNIIGSFLPLGTSLSGNSNGLLVILIPKIGLSRFNVKKAQPIGPIFLC